MEILQGISDVLEPTYLLFCLLGVTIGQLVGVLPGLGPTATMAMLLPVVLTVEDPAASIIMLAGVYYGSQFGNSTASILANIPGTPAALPACFDGFPMTKQGRAGQALWAAAVSSFIGCTFGILVISFVGTGFAGFALQFGPAEYLALLTFALVSVVALSPGSFSKALGAAVFGMVLASVGPDAITGGQIRFGFGLDPLQSGLSLIPLVVGLFGIGEVLKNSETSLTRIYSGKLGKMVPQGKDLRRSLAGAVRGTLLGFPLGLLPGVTTAVASFMAYDLEKRVSKRGDEFGTGVIEGVSAPEAANNANAQGGFIPLLAFGVPADGALAILLAAFILHGVQPGPLLFTQNADLAFVVIGSMYIGNVMLLILNLPLVGLWARICLIPYKYLAPIILAVCFVAAYATRNTMVDVWIALAAGVLGYLMRKGAWPIGPLVLGIILGPMLEVRLSQVLNMGGVHVVAERPIAIAFVVGIAVILTTRFARRLVRAVQGDKQRVGSGSQ